jgi:glycosyltransferase involved in cell wall biosynthesis
MTEYPLLSVIVPAFAFDKYIVECIESILSQNTDFEMEILVRDDHSGDRTNDILYSKYHENKKVHILFSTENLGPFGNIKFLLERARGKYIAYIDGDDYFTDENKLQKQIDFLESHPDYFMHSTGYRNLLLDGVIYPPDGKWNIPLKSDLTYLDLLESNMVTFGRVFRNSPGLMKEWMLDSPYLDWAFNFQASLIGKIKCEAWCSGIYRHSENGMFSLKTQEQKDADNSYIRSLLAERLAIKNRKITIIDCFAHNEAIKIKLKDAIRKIKSTGCDVMLISNTSMERNIIDMCDFYLYDKRNQLFKKEYSNVNDVDFFNSTGPFVAHNVKPGLQRHGLSVLVNLFNALNTAKSMGYTHFQRIECDDIFGSISLATMSNSEDMCIREGKKGLFYFNENPDENNISFHYFYCEIDYFLNSVNPISKEDDYIEYLMRENGNMDFVIAESYVYANLLKSGRENIINKSGRHDMDLDFPDTIWNTETSGSNIDEKYNGCLTEIYKTYNGDGTQGTNVVYSYNYSEESKKRIMDIYTDSYNYHIEHSCGGKGAWTYTPIPDDVIYIDVCEDDIKLYSQKNENIKSYLKFI